MPTVTVGGLSRRDLYLGEDVFLPQFLGVGPRVLGEPTPSSLVSVRRLGAIIVTVAWVPRPAGLSHTRAIGFPLAHGLFIVGPPALAHTRSQGRPQLSARVGPLTVTHARALGSPAVNPARPLAITHTRALGSHTVTILWIARPASIAHTRSIGAIAIHGRLDIDLAGLTRTRTQGNPQLSGHASPASLVHQRQTSAIEINVKILGPVALSRV